MGTTTVRALDPAEAARLIGEPARATMLEALMAGVALPAGELARRARVRPATASEHLARLQSGGLVTVHTSGRHRYYALASPEVADALEALALIGTAEPVRSFRQSREATAMALARTCYDHLAGKVGVAVLAGLIERSALRAGGDGYEVTDAGEALLSSLGVDLAATAAQRRLFAKPCVDFTERRPHLAGALGAAICRRLLELGWVERLAPGGRALRVLPAGRRGLAAAFGVTLG
jgi:DNA-binding transcriptional ArsR family regulator